MGAHFTQNVKRLRQRKTRKRKDSKERGEKRGRKKDKDEEELRNTGTMNVKVVDTS